MGPRGVVAILGGASEGPWGGARASKGGLGGPFGPIGRSKNYEKTLELGIYLPYGVSWGGPGTDAEPTTPDSRARNPPRGLRTKARDHKGPTGALPGRPRRPPHIDKASLKKS